MIIALATYGARLASLFDTAPQLCLYLDSGHDCCLTAYFDLGQSSLGTRVSILRENEVQALICGGISGCTHRILSESGIQVIPWIRGQKEEVLAAWQKKDFSHLAMPGCQRHCRGRGRLEKQKNYMNKHRRQQ